MGGALFFRHGCDFPVHRQDIFGFSCEALKTMQHGHTAKNNLSVKGRAIGAGQSAAMELMVMAIIVMQT
ncbi:hypothetical protein [Gluconacetobacter asukensis]|uniref:Uncharacterized protein n=1 Tax=Gluconacetobacter asukensis TaxID=1017181 RepID=A0A7W4P2M3_9PROT|nr:hypothetical protein [Gluconacetobacter asukensis]MBB2171885.1 hypothetical protein [Gluconacetobacter asukensis]